MEIYIIENFEEAKFDAFKSKQMAQMYVKQYYRDHMHEWYASLSTEDFLKAVLKDIEALGLDLPYIEDVMYMYKTYMREE